MLTSEIATRHAKQDDVPLILCSFRKAEFDQSMGAFMGRLQTTEAKLVQLYSMTSQLLGVIC